MGNDDVPRLNDQTSQTPDQTAARGAEGRAWAEALPGPPANDNDWIMDGEVVQNGANLSDAEFFAQLTRQAEAAGWQLDRYALCHMNDSEEIGRFARLYLEQYPNAVTNIELFAGRYGRTEGAKSQEIADLLRNAIAKVKGATGELPVAAGTAVFLEEDIARDTGQLGREIPGVGLVVVPVIAGGAALVTGASWAKAATRAADTVVPASAVKEGRYAEAALDFPQKAIEMLIPIPVVGTAIGRALTDIPRQMLRARAYNVDPSIAEQYSARLKTEYSVAEVRDGLLKPDRPIYKQVAADFGAQYDQMVMTMQQDHGNLSSMPPRDVFIRTQIDAALKPILTPSPTLALIPSGIPRPGA